MNISWRRWNWQLGLASFLALGGTFILEKRAFAQVVPNNTLSSKNSTVTSTGAADSIKSSAARGINLFHSFQEFKFNQQDFSASQQFISALDSS